MPPRSTTRIKLFSSRSYLSSNDLTQSAESESEESSSDDGEYREIGTKDALMTQAWVQDVRSAYEVYCNLDKTKREGSAKKGQGQNSHQDRGIAPTRKRQTVTRTITVVEEEWEEPESQEPPPKFRTRQTATKTSIGVEEDQNESVVQEAPPKPKKQTYRKRTAPGVDEYRRL